MALDLSMKSRRKRSHRDAVPEDDSPSPSHVAETRDNNTSGASDACALDLTVPGGKETSCYSLNSRVTEVMVTAET